DTTMAANAKATHEDGTKPSGTLRERSGPGAAVLRLKGVGRSYSDATGRLDVLSGADLEIHAGEMVALVAPSGAGKSTLLHLAGLLERPDSGEVEIGGRAMETLSDAHRTAMRRTEIG